MAKLYFNYGTMESSKSLQLLAVAHNYESQGKNVLCFKPRLDTRDEGISTRAGFNRKAYLLDKEDVHNVYEKIAENRVNVDCILIDEAQFLTSKQVLMFSMVADKLDIPVIAYGLKTDFATKLFEGSGALLALADKITEIKTVCYFCNSKAIMNMRFCDGKAVFHGDAIKIGDTSIEAECYYKPTCRSCYHSHFEKHAMESIKKQ